MSRRTALPKEKNSATLQRQPHHFQRYRLDCRFSIRTSRVSLRNLQCKNNLARASAHCCLRCGQPKPCWRKDFGTNPRTSSSRSVLGFPQIKPDSRNASLQRFNFSLEQYPLGRECSTGAGRCPNNNNSRNSPSVSLPFLADSTGQVQSQLPMTKCLDFAITRELVKPRLRTIILPFTECCNRNSKLGTKCLGIASRCDSFHNKDNILESEKTSLFPSARWPSSVSQGRFASPILALMAGRFLT